MYGFNQQISSFLEQEKICLERNDFENIISLFQEMGFSNDVTEYYKHNLDFEQ